MGTGEVGEGFMEATTGPGRVVLILHVSTPASPALPRLGLSADLPPLLLPSVLNLLYLGSPSAPVAVSQHL